MQYPAGCFLVFHRAASLCHEVTHALHIQHVSSGVSEGGAGRSMSWWDSLDHLYTHPGKRTLSQLEHLHCSPSQCIAVHSAVCSATMATPAFSEPTVSTYTSTLAATSGTSNSTTSTATSSTTTTTTTTSTTATTTTTVQVIIFSKDRAFQLQQCLRTLLAHCCCSDGLHVTVLWTASTPQLATSYKQLASAAFPTATGTACHVSFVHEESFAAQLVDMLTTSSHPFTLFLVDDALFVRAFNLGLATQLLQQRDQVVAFHLKLGARHWYCHPANKVMRLPSSVPCEGDLQASGTPHAGVFIMRATAHHC